MKVFRLALAGVSAFVVALVTGCSGLNGTAPITTSDKLMLSGAVHGGQQPVAGASIQLYTTGTGGYGSAATPLLSTPAISGSDGSFNITTPYNCTGGLVYLLATGGNAGGGMNSAIDLAATLGPCSGISSSTDLTVNELTTVATAYALNQFIVDPTHIGSNGTAQSELGLQNAMTTANLLVNMSNGTSSASTSAGATLPQKLLDTVADALATCVNAVTTTSACGNLFGDTTAGTNVPADTFQAAINIVKNPKLNLTTITNLAVATAPFQPILSGAPSDWAASINYFNLGGEAGCVAIDSQGNTWVGDFFRGVNHISTSGAITSFTSGYQNRTYNRFSACAVDFTDTAYFSGIYSAQEGIFPISSNLTQLPILPLSSAVGNLAVDTAGNIWADTGAAIVGVTAFGTAAPHSPFTGGGLSSSGTGEWGSMAFDTAGNLWVANTTAAVVSAFNSSGVSIEGTSGYAASSVSAANSVAIDNAGNIWGSGTAVYKLNATGTQVSTSGYSGGDYFSKFVGAGIIDGLGNYWAEGCGNACFAEFSNSGTAVTTSTGLGYSTIGESIEGPIAIDPSGNLWSGGGSGVVELIGAAAPVTTPTVAAVKACTLGVRPGDTSAGCL